MSAAAAQSCAAPRSPRSAPGEALVRTLWSGSAAAPSASSSRAGSSAVESERMRAPLQEGDFPFPVKYGYCAVGRRRGRAARRSSAGRCSRCTRTRIASSAPAGMLAPVPRRRAGAAGGARRQHGDGAERALGFGRRAGRPDRRRRRRRGRAPRRRSRGPAAGGGGHAGRRRSVARATIAAPSRLRLPEAARRARRRGRRLPRQRDARPALPAPWPAPASRRRSSR